MEESGSSPPPPAGLGLQEEQPHPVLLPNTVISGQLRDGGSTHRNGSVMNSVSAAGVGSSSCERLRTKEDTNLFPLGALYNTPFLLAMAELPTFQEQLNFKLRARNWLSTPIVREPLVCV